MGALGLAPWGPLWYFPVGKIDIGPAGIVGRCGGSGSRGLTGLAVLFFCLVGTGGADEPSTNPRWQAKWLELLSEIAPGLKRAAFMFNPDTPVAWAFVPSLETAARSLKVVPITAAVHSDVEIETAIVALGREPGGGLVVMPGANVHRASIISAAARNNVPAVYTVSAFARDGGLLSYGVDQVDISRRAATYVDRILRGAKLADPEA